MGQLRSRSSCFVLSNLLGLAALMGCMTLAGCGGGSGNSGEGSQSSSPTIASVSVSCTPSSILITQTAACAPTVAGTGNFSSSVKWSVSPSNIGTVSGTGVFTPSGAGTATVTAMSTQDAAKSGSATVTVGPSLVSVQPGAVLAGSVVTVSATGADTQNLSNDTIIFTQTGRPFFAHPSAVSTQGGTENFTVPLPQGMSPTSSSASFAVPTSVSFSTNGIAAQNTSQVQVQPPPHALAVFPSSAAQATSLSLSFNAVLTSFNSSSTISSDDPNLTFTNASAMSSTLMTATLSIGAATSLGKHAITIGSGKSTIAFAFTVLAAPASSPSISGLSATRLAPGAPFTISGSGFLPSSDFPQAVIRYSYAGIVAEEVEATESDSQLSTNIPLLIDPSTGSPFVGSVAVQVIVEGEPSNSVPVSILALPANTGTIGATTQAYLNSLFEQVTEMPTQLTATLPNDEIATFNDVLSAAAQQLQEVQSEVATAAAGGQVTAPDGSVITQSTIDTIDRLLQTSGISSTGLAPAISKVPSGNPSSANLIPLTSSTDQAAITLSETALVSAGSLCKSGDIANNMSNVLTNETLAVCAASLIGVTAPVTGPVCNFLKLFAPAQVAIDLGNLACNVAPVNLAVITPDPASKVMTVNGVPVTESPTGIFQSEGSATGQVAETVTDLILTRLHLENGTFRYILGNKIAASIVDEVFEHAVETLIGNFIDTSAPTIFYFQTNSIPLTMLSFQPNPFFTFSGLTMTPGSAAGTTTVYFDTSNFRDLDPSGSVTDVSSEISGNQIKATIQTSVSVTPDQANVAAGETVQFSASVIGVGPSLSGVLWSVDGISGGSTAIGLISSSGLYTAPTANGTHTITAASVFDGSIGSAGITVTSPSNNPIPSISSLLPSSLPAGSASQTLTINGAGFLPSSTVTFNEIGHAVSFVNANQLTISLTSSDLAAAGTYAVLVTNPAPGGGSATATFTVTAPQMTISPSSVSVPEGAIQTFSASVPGGGSVGWSVQEGAAGGAISPAGIYTAPGTTGTFHVVATDSANPQQTATATVTLVAAPHYTVLYSFPYAFESAALVQGTDGDIYGTNEMIAFKIDSSGNFTQVARISASPTAPISNLTQASDGNFYGTDSQGNGSVFKMDASGNITSLFSFPNVYSSSNTGVWPWAGLTQASDGDFYGTTYAGGNLACTVDGFGIAAYGPFDFDPTTGDGCGTIFRIDSSGNETVLYAFSGQADGNFPQASLIQGSDGDLYGTASGGGTDGFGTIFKISLSGQFQVLHSFSQADDAAPVASLIQASDGYLYGTAACEVCGGGNARGEVFRIDTSGNNFTILHTFTGPDGAFPVASLIQGKDGYFYGTTWSGGDLTCGPYYSVTGYPYFGTGGCGTVFKMDLSGNVTVLHDFEEPQSDGDGDSPYAGLIQGKDGNLYGTTYFGGTAVYFGTIFKIEFP